MILSLFKYDYKYGTSQSTDAKSDQYLTNFAETYKLIPCVGQSIVVLKMQFDHKDHSDPNSDEIVAQR